MTTVLEHPQSFKEGVRVLHLLSRNKDEAERAPTILRVSNNVEEFDRQLESLLKRKGDNQRLYVSAEPRDLVKAVRSFRLAQLNSEYDQDPLRFYTHLENRWTTALMQKSNAVKDEKLWLVDCDTEEEYQAWKHFEDAQYNKYDHVKPPYEYATKNGRHVMITPCHVKHEWHVMSGLVHKNPLMLWAY